MEPPQQLLAVVGRARRKLLVTRVLESAGVCAAVASGGAAVCMGAWMLARSVPAAALALGLVPLAAGAVLEGRRSLAADTLSPAEREVCAWMLGILGLVAIVSAWSDDLRQTHQAWVLLAVPAAAGAGAISRAARSVSQAQAAAYLDNRGRMRQRLITAVDLCAHDTQDTPAGQVVLAQATAMLDREKPQQGSFRQRGGRALAACILAGLLACTLAVAPGPRGELDLLAQRLAAMGPAQRERLSNALQQAARRQQDPEARAEMLRTAKVVLLDDPEQLQRLLEALARRGVHLEQVARDALPADLARGSDGGEGPSDTHTGHSTDPNAPPRPTPRSAEGSNIAEGIVRVFDPRYSQAASAEPNAPLADEQPYLDYRDAWSAAQARAGDSIRSGSVPVEYVPVVRRFFELERE